MADIIPTIYNLNHQKLNADKLKDLNAFSSDNYGGFIGTESPLSIEGDTIKLAACTMIAGGMLIDIPKCEHTFTGENNLWYVCVTLKDTVNNVLIDYTDSNTLTSFNQDIVKLNECKCSEFEQKHIQAIYSPVTSFQNGKTPAQLGYYEYNSTSRSFTLTTDTSIDISKTYYYLYENETFYLNTTAGGSNPLRPEDPFSYAYAGKIIWIANDTNAKKFVIPICAKESSGNIIEIIQTRDLNAFENLLSNEAYALLKKHLEENFVGSIGGQEQIGGHCKGDIGYLNITQNRLQTNSNATNVIINKPILEIDGSISDISSFGLVVIDPQSGLISKTTTENKVPISRGGTGARTKQTAKENLGISYGITLPASGEEGDIFLKIIE